MQTDYDRMAEAIRFIDETRDGQPGLEEVAAHLGLSGAHFQRMFSRWAGVSPKKYQQYLTLDHAKTLLRDRFTVLDTALESGLSGPGRLHDLLVTWEAMTPGEYASGGADLEISYGFAPSLFGEALILWTSRGICGMGFTAEMGKDECLTDMTRRWPHATYVQDDSGAKVQIDRIFDRNRPKGRKSKGREGCRHRRGAQSGLMADPVSPRFKEIWRVGRLSLGPACKAGNAGL